MLKVKMDDRELMDKLWEISRNLPEGTNPEIPFALGMAVGTISRLSGEVARLQGALRREQPGNGATAPT